MADHDAPLSPDLLLRRAAAGDAARAGQLLASVSSVRLLDAVLSQAELATDGERTRPSGIDAIAELDRASIEIMDMPQGAPVAGDRIADGDTEARSGATPMLVGWELATVETDQLEAAAVTLATRPWQLALVAFADTIDRHGVRFRRVVAAAADGRVAAAQLRFTDPDTSPDVLDAVVTRDTRDLADDAALATSLLAGLRASSRPS